MGRERVFYRRVRNACMSSCRFLKSERVHAIMLPRLDEEVAPGSAGSMLRRRERGFGVYSRLLLFALLLGL